MKLHIKLTIILIYLFPGYMNAQTAFKKGFIVTASNEKIEGSIEALFKGKGRIIFLSEDNRKQTYSPSDLKSFRTDSSDYISYSNDFYEEISVGPKASLYQKVTDNRDEKIYNGTEVVGFVKTTEGKPGDFYFFRAGETKFDLITKKNFKDYFVRLFNNNDSLALQIKNESLDYTQIKKVVDIYNN